MRYLSFVLCGSLLLSSAGLLSFSSPPVEAAEQAQPKPVPVVFKQLTAGVWMHTSIKRMEKWGDVPSNGLIVEKGAASILVDTAWDDQQTAQIMAWAKDTLKKPVRWAVFTHAHEDKMGGVAELRSKASSPMRPPTPINWPQLMD